MHITSLMVQLNSHDIKDLNKYHMLSIFSQNNWKISRSDINSPQLQRYIDVDLDSNITVTHERHWLLFTNTVYGINVTGYNEWEELLRTIEITENDIETSIKNGCGDTKAEIEDIINYHWRSVAYFVLARDIAKHNFDVSDIGTFFTSMRIIDSYTKRAQQLMRRREFSDHNLISYYNNHQDDFWCQLFILDFISDGQIGYDFIDESGMFTENELPLNQAEIYHHFSEQQSEPDYKLDDIVNPVEEYHNSFPTYNEADISGGMDIAYEPVEVINTSDMQSTTSIDVSFNDPEPEPTRPVYEDSSDSDDSDDSDSDD